jgi:hypothetical protein
VSGGLRSTCGRWQRRDAKTIPAAGAGCELVRCCVPAAAANRPNAPAGSQGHDLQSRRRCEEHNPPATEGVNEGGRGNLGCGWTGEASRNLLRGKAHALQLERVRAHAMKVC